MIKLERFLRKCIAKWKKLKRNMIKILSNLYSAVDHVILVVIEATNIETVNTLLIEVGFVSFNTIKVSYVIPSEEIAKNY
jgi:hypothetical protein